MEIPRRRLSQIVSAMGMAEDLTSEFDEPYVLLPVQALAPAVVHIDLTSVPLSEQMALVLPPATLLPEFLAAYLSSELGIDQRRHLLQGRGAARRLPRARIAALEVPYPPLDAQVRYLDLLSAASSAESRVAELRNALWSQPSTGGEIELELAGLASGESFDAWVGTLPYPLASILWSYRSAAPTDPERWEMLVQFFEALCAFFSTILMSVLFDRREDRPQEWAEFVASTTVVNPSGKRRSAFDRPTFGTWHNALTKASKILLREVSSETAGTKSSEMRRLMSSRALMCAASPAMAALIQVANQTRNDWRGHGGKITPVEASELHAKLRALLDQVRGLMGRSWAYVDLLQAESMTLIEGRFEVVTKILRGPAGGFLTSSLIAESPMSNDGLYLSSEGTQQPLEVLPLFEVTGPPTPSTFYFSRVESDGLRMISFDSHATSVLTVKNPRLETLLNCLREPVADQQKVNTP